MQDYFKKKKLTCKTSSTCRLSYLGPGDIFHDGIVAPLLKQLKKEEKKFEKFMRDNACMSQAEYREYEEDRARELKDDMGDPDAILDDLKDLAGIGKKQDQTTKNEG